MSRLFLNIVMNNKAKIISLILILFIAIISIMAYLIYQAKNKETFNGFYNEKVLDDFSLKDGKGRDVSLSEYKGKLVLLNFGYTSCPDICPTTLGNLRSIYSKLDEKQDDVQVVFISIDPDRDNPEKLDEYVNFFNDDFIGLTGTEDQLKEVSDIFNIFYFKEGVNTDKDYLMSHPTSIYLIDREGKLILKYPHNTKQEFVVEDLKRLL